MWYVWMASLCVGGLLSCNSDGGEDGLGTSKDAGELREKSDSTMGADSDSGRDVDVNTAPVALPFEIEVQLASELNPASPGTVAIVTWSVEGVSIDRAEIDFGLDMQYGMTAPVALADPEHRTVLLGMKPNRTYHFRVTVESGSDVYVSADHLIETGPATNLVTVSSEMILPGMHEPGFIITNQFSRQQGAVAFIIDSDGEIIWWYESDIGQLSRARMSYDGKYMWLVPDRGDYASDALEAIRMDTLASYFVEDAGASHDGTSVNSDVFAYINYGEGDCGSVFEVREDGALAEIFESSEYFPGLVPPECHMNALRYNEAEGLYTVSDRDHDIFLIDRQGEIHWQLSDIVDNTSYGAEHHGHQLLPDSIILFANLGGAGLSSAAIEFSLTDGREIFRYDPGVFSVWLGDVQRLPEGNTLVTFSVAGEIHEVDPDGNLVRRIEIGNTLGYSMWRPTLYGPPVDLLM